MWQRIVEHAGQDFATVTGIPFTYELHAEQQIWKRQAEIAALQVRAERWKGIVAQERERDAEQAAKLVGVDLLRGE